MERPDTFNKMNEGPVVVIGGGIGGLTASIYLAAAGRQVVLLEKNARVGGKMGEIQMEGFRWDTGPSVVTMRWVLEDLFSSLNRRLSDYLDLVPIEPLTRYFYPDGTQFDATRNISRMAEQIGLFGEEDIAGYLAYLSYCARLHQITGPAFIYGPSPSMSSFKKVPPADWFRFRSISHHAKSDRRFCEIRQTPSDPGQVCYICGC